MIIVTKFKSLLMPAGSEKNVKKETYGSAGTKKSTGPTTGSSQIKTGQLIRRPVLFGLKLNSTVHSIRRFCPIIKALSV